MSWGGFQIECWSALGPAGSSPGDGVGFCVLRRLWRGLTNEATNGLDGRDSRTTQAALDRWQERESDRGPARQWRDPQCGDRKGASAGPCGPGQNAEREHSASSAPGAPASASGRRPAPQRSRPAMMRGATAFALAPQALSELEQPRGIRERRPADVAPGDDRRAEKIDVPLAAGRPGDFRIPLLRLARGVRPLLHVPWRPRLPAGPGPATRSRSLTTGSAALSGPRAGGWLSLRATSDRPTSRSGASNAGEGRGPPPSLRIPRRGRLERRPTPAWLSRFPWAQLRQDLRFGFELTARRRRGKDGCFRGSTWWKRPGGLEFRHAGPRAPRTGSAPRSASAAGSGSPSVMASSMRSTIHASTRLASATSGSSSPTATLSSPRSSATARRSSSVSKTGFPLSG